MTSDWFGDHAVEEKHFGRNTAPSGQCCQVACVGRPRSTQQQRIKVKLDFTGIAAMESDGERAIHTPPGPPRKIDLMHPAGVGSCWVIR